MRPSASLAAGNRYRCAANAPARCRVRDRRSCRGRNSHRRVQRQDYLGADRATAIRQRGADIARRAGFPRAVANSSWSAACAGQEQLHSNSRSASSGGSLRWVFDCTRSMGCTSRCAADVEHHFAGWFAERVERYHHPRQCRRSDLGGDEHGAYRIASCARLDATRPGISA